VVFEVMTDRLERTWWTELCARLERELDQQELLIRAHEVDRL
jgi:hypothetical protein